MPMSMPMYMFIVYRLSFFAYRTLASYYNGLLCHMRALARILPNPQFNRRPHSPVPAPAVPAPPRPT